MMRPICLVMILTLIFSLLEALLILPSHLVGNRLSVSVSPLHKLRQQLNQKLERFVDDYYRPYLQTAIAWRYLTAALFIGLLLLSGALVISDRVRQSINPDVSKDSFWVQFNLPQSAPL